MEQGLTHIVRGVGNGAEGMQVGACQHSGVDQTMAALVEGAEEFEFDTGRLVGDKDDDMSLRDKGIHEWVGRRGNETDVGERSDKRTDDIGGVASGDDKRHVDHRKDVVDEPTHGSNILGHREIAVVEGERSVGDIGTKREDGRGREIVVGRERAAMESGDKRDVVAAEGAEMGLVGSGDGKDSRGTEQDRLEVAQTGGFDSKKGTVKKIAFGVGKMMVVIVFDIMCADDKCAIGGIEVKERVATVEAFEQDGIVVESKTTEEGLRGTGGNDERTRRELAEERHIALIVADLLAEIVELLGGLTAIEEAVEMDTDTGVGESLDAEEDIDDAAIVGGPRDVESDDVEVHRVWKIED